MNVFNRELTLNRIVGPLWLPIFMMIYSFIISLGLHLSIPLKGTLRKQLQGNLRWGKCITETEMSMKFLAIKLNVIDIYLELFSFS